MKKLFIGLWLLCAVNVMGATGLGTVMYRTNDFSLSPSNILSSNSVAILTKNQTFTGTNIFTAPTYGNGTGLTNLSGTNVDFVAGANMVFTTNNHQVSLAATLAGGAASLQDATNAAIGVGESNKLSVTMTNLTAKSNAWSDVALSVKGNQTNEYDIERACIRFGGQWIDQATGLSRGKGLFTHYRNLQSILWPEDDHHRWSDLILRNILENNVTCLLGAKDSSKTYTVAKYALTDYFCWPECTLILISSTDLRGLELRVWGNLKDLYDRARQRYDVPGNIIDYKHTICTDDIREGDVRDLRKGIICFIEGTQVDTPTGPVRIEDLKENDVVFNAIGTGRILSTQTSIAPQLVRVHLSNGTAIDCTPEHPFLTHRGWIKALALHTYDRVYSAHETVQIMQESAWTGIPESEVLFCQVPRHFTSQTMRLLPNIFPAFQTKATQQTNLGKILQHCLRKPMGFGKPLWTEKDYAPLFELSQDNEISASESLILFGELSQSSTVGEVRRMRERIYVDSTNPITIQNTILRSILQIEIQQSFHRNKPCEDYQAGTDDFHGVPDRPITLSNFDRSKNQTQSDSFLRSRHCVSVNQTGHRNRWRITPNTRQAETRFNQDSGIIPTWVEGVEILKPEGDERFCKSEGGYRVHNLHVEGHPSYSVNGIIVHNCIPCLSSSGSFDSKALAKYCGVKQKRRRMLGDEVQFMSSGFMDAIANIGSGDFKGVFMGNPLGSDDPLDKVAEPKEGWSSLPEPTKTTIWDNKFMGGKTINLVGTDSPNYDFPQDEPPKYPYLINQREIDKVASFYGKDSLQYWSQCMGIRRTGLNAHRVITWQMCKQFGALDDVIWQGSRLTKVFALDAAYGGCGGDRCVGGHIEFGPNAEGRIVIRINPPQLVPVSVKHEDSPEDQIADWCRDYCEERDITPDYCFYDSTGRGSLGTAFSRRWSDKVNPIEFGGKPSLRPVSLDMFTYDEKQHYRRLKRCEEHYSKFVTELWFSVRYAIESRQLKNLPQDVMQEGCSREWKMVRGNKIEIETKADTKERMGRSPDLFDWLATSIEGARQKGFVIAKLLAEDAAASTNDWIRDIAREQIRKYRTRQLTYT